jgi:hypothetical protein
VYHSRAEFPGSAVVAVWSRTRNGKTSFYGVDSDFQRERVLEYFKNSMVVMFGQSPTPPIMNCISNLFGKCIQAKALVGRFAGKRTFEQICNTNQSQAELGSSLGELPEGWVYLAADRNVNANDLKAGNEMNHSITIDSTSVDGQVIHYQQASRLNPLKFTLIVEHPISHLQNQQMMQHSWDYTASLQKQWAQNFLNKPKRARTKHSSKKKGLG